MPDQSNPLEAFKASAADQASSAPDDDQALEEFDDDGAVDPDFYRHGGVSLSDSEREALGDLSGKRVLVVQAGNGEDALSLRNLGAAVTVVDDAESLEEARALAEAAGIEIDFLEDDPGAISVDLSDGHYDVVYSGFSSLAWLPSLPDWAAGISQALPKGGRLVIYDEHPFARVFGEDEASAHLLVANSYFGEVVEWEDDEGVESEGEDDDEAAPGGDEDLEDTGAEVAAPEWTLGDIVNALGTNDLAVTGLYEFPESDRYETTLDTLVDVDYDEVSRVPGAMLIVAVKL